MLDAFRRVIQALRAGASAGERRTGLSTAQLFALQQIAEAPGASVNDVAARTFTHQSSVSAVIQRLVERGLVARTADADDRRRQRLEITAAGRRALHRSPAAVQERLIAAVAALRATERRELSTLLNAVARVVAPSDVATPPAMLFEDDHGVRRRRVRAPRKQR